MSTLEAGMERAAQAPITPAGAGASLKSARERAGLSLDQVAQQLKLAPRQVKALEEQDFERLPGRTFVRGFVRNYARLLELDGDALLAQLPDGAHAPALAAPALHSTGATMAEVPTGAVRPAFGRWLVPLVLVSCIVGAGAYEWYRSGSAGPAQPTGGEPTAGAAPAGTARSELPNPLAQAPIAESAPLETPESGGPSVAANPPQAATSASGTPDGTAAPGAATARPDTGAPQSAETSSQASDAPVVLSYRGPSWTEVRDRDGNVVLARLVPAGSEQTIGGAPPFDLVIGNASAVTLVYRGKTVDLGRHMRQGVARLRLP